MTNDDGAPRDPSQGVTTVAGLLAERAALHPLRPMLTCANETLTYDETASRARCIARGLRSEGLQPGDRLGMFCEHSLDAWLLLLGCASAGVVPVLVNWRLAPPEATYIVEDAGCVAVVASTMFADMEAQIPLSPQRRRPEVGEWVDQLMSVGATTAAELELGHAPQPDDCLVQLYTSGTTGLPKGVLTSNRAMMSLLDVMGSEIAGFSADSVHLVAAPLFHIAGYAYGLVGLSSGAQSVLVPMFEPAEVLRLIAAHRCTNSLLVPAMLQAVVEHPAAATTDLDSMRGVLYGASPISIGLIARATATLGCHLTQAYGLTETTGLISFLRWDDHERGLAARREDPGTDEHVAAVERLNSAGTPYPGCRIRVVDPNGNECGNREPGEVLAASPTLMTGYWGHSDSGAIDGDGWFHTGDIGFIDDGYLFLVDRLNDKVVTKGENVFPAEVDRVLSEHDAIHECCVIGIPDDDLGEKLIVVAVFRDGFDPSLDELQEFCRGRLAGFKLPRGLVVSDEPLPRTPSGKILRREIREPYWVGRDRGIN